MLVYTVLTTAKYTVCQQPKFVCIPDNMDVEFSDKDNRAI